MHKACKVARKTLARAHTHTHTHKAFIESFKNYLIIKWIKKCGIFSGILFRLK